MKSRPPTVIAMLKAPRAGLVKTRLAAAVGDQHATAIYRCLVEHQLAQIPIDWPVEIHFAPADAADEMQRWLGSSYRYFAQPPGDLGRRLIGAFEGAFQRSAPAVIALGGDCPEVDHASLWETSDRLRTEDVVLGPACDGGYYLIALRQMNATWFRDIPWSTPTVLEVTLDRLRTAGVSPSLLPVKEDVDDLPSWERARTRVPAISNLLQFESDLPS